MQTQYFEAKNVNLFEKPLKEIVELNVKTFQKFSYVTPTELFKAGKPEEFLHKNIEMIIENSHKTLDYMQNMFSIVEKHLLKTSDEIIDQTQNIARETKKVARRNVNKVVKAGERVEKKLASNVRAATKSAGRSTKAAIHKGATQIKKASGQAGKKAQKRK